MTVLQQPSNAPILVVPQAGNSFVGTTITGKSRAIDCRGMDFAQINVILLTTGTVQVQVANQNIDTEFTSFGASFTATGNLTIDPVWQWLRLNVTANGSGVTANVVLGERV